MSRIFEHMTKYFWKYIMYVSLLTSIMDIVARDQHGAGIALVAGLVAYLAEEQQEIKKMLEDLPKE
jgi:hypothetical protein